MTKPVVHYVNALYPIQEGAGALIDGVNDHPDTFNVSPGADYVRTSKVVKYDPATGNFETLNTQYVKSDKPAPLPASMHGLMGVAAEDC